MMGYARARENENSRSWRNKWCLEVANGWEKNHGFTAMMDPFLWHKFDSVWDDAIELYGRMPSRKDEFSGNEIYEYMIVKAREFSETWADRINDLKEPLLVDPSFIDRSERQRLAYLKYLDSKTRSIQ